MNIWINEQLKMQTVAIILFKCDFIHYQLGFGIQKGWSIEKYVFLQNGFLVEKRCILCGADTVCTPCDVTTWYLPHS